MKNPHHVLNDYGKVLTLACVFSSNLVFASSVVHVTNNNDSGTGSLRAALSSGASQVVIPNYIGDITTSSTLSYDGTSPLTIIGSGQTVDGSNHDETLLNISQGANLNISNLNFTGAGNYSVFNQGGGKGILVDVPQDKTGVVSLKLSNVAVVGVGRHGVHVSDCDLATCGAGGGGGGDGSSASIHASLSNVTIQNVGYGSFDSDGIRIDDRGDGDIVFKVKYSSFIDVGADGIELDEGNDGDVIVKVKDSIFLDNGGYCAPIDISGFPESEVELDTGPGHPSTADDRCVEWDETEYVLDLDDGFDIDEAGSGSLLGSVKRINISDNLDEGLDFDEEGEDGISLLLVDIVAHNNGDEGVKISEADEGDVLAKLRGVSTVSNGDDGIQVEEEDDGDIFVVVKDSESLDNKSSKAGLNVSQDGSGTGTLKVRNSNIDSIDTNVDEI